LSNKTAIDAGQPVGGMASIMSGAWLVGYSQAAYMPRSGTESSLQARMHERDKSKGKEK
jgi:hypothetical protein